MELKQFSWNRVLVGVAILVFLIFAAPIYLPIVFAILIALFLSPSVKALERLLKKSGYKNGKRNLATLVVVLSAFIALFGLIFFVFQPLIKELASFVATLPETVRFFKRVFSQTLLDSQSQYFALPPQVQTIIDNGIQQVFNFVVARVTGFFQLVGSLTSAVINLVIMPFLVYYFLRDGEYLMGTIVNLAPVRRRKSILEVLHEIAYMLARYIRGQLLICAIVAIIVFAGTTVIGVPYPVVLATLAFLLESIPYAGPFLAFIPAFLLAYSVSTEMAFQVVIFYLIVVFLENYVIQPKIMGEVLRTHPVKILLAMLLAANLFGLIGMLLAVPFMATMRILIRFTWNWK